MTVPRPYLDRTATVPRPYLDRTATAPEEYQWFGSLTFQRAILYFASLLLLDEVLSAVNRLSLAFQRSTIDLTTIPPFLNSTVQALEKIKLESADSFKAKVEHLIAQTVEEGTGLHLPELKSASTPETTMISKTGAGEPERYDDQIRQKFVEKVITNVKERFPQVGILEAFSILDPSGVLGEPETSMEYLSMLLDQYDVGIDRSDCEKEYTQFTSFVKDHTILRKMYNFAAVIRKCTNQGENY